MKANELRIGNFVQRKKQVLKVLNVQWDKVLLKGYPAGNRYFKLNNIEPIKLTEDWLLKLGFQPFKNNQYWFRIGINGNTLNVSLSGNAEIESFNREIVQLSDICENLHQLQNLFFSLAGKELFYF